MLKTAQKLAGGDGGIVMRTNAVGAKPADLKEEIKYLRGLYATALEAYATASVGDMVFRDADVHARLLRDVDLSSVDKIYIGDEKTYRRTEAALRRTRVKNKLVLYDGKREMFEAFGLEEQVYKLMSSRVPLENGAYLIFDRTEALTAIDVNTGRFTGETALEDTVFETNLLAAREIALAGSAAQYRRHRHCGFHRHGGGRSPQCGRGGAYALFKRGQGKVQRQPDDGVGACPVYAQKSKERYRCHADKALPRL